MMAGERQEIQTINDNMKLCRRLKDWEGRGGEKGEETTEAKEKEVKEVGGGGCEGEILWGAGEKGADKR